MTISTTRIAVIGTGFGARVHVPTLRQIADVEVVGILGRDRTKTSEVASDLKVPVATTDLNDLMALGLDAVTVAIPPGDVEAVVTRLLAGRLPVLCEKPLGHDLASARRLVEMSTGLVTAVNYQFADIPCIQDFKRLLAERPFGEVLGVSVIWMAQSDAHKIKAQSWKLSVQSGGGAAAMLGVHAGFLLTQFFGNVEVLGRTKSNLINSSILGAQENAAADTIMINGRLDGRAPFQLMISNGLAVDPIHRWEVLCEDGLFVLENATADHLNGFGLHVCGPEPLPFIETQSGRIDASLPLFQRFVDAVRGGSTAHPDFSDALCAQQIVFGP